MNGYAVSLDVDGKDHFSNGWGRAATSTGVPTVSTVVFKAEMFRVPVVLFTRMRDTRAQEVTAGSYRQPCANNYKAPHNI